MPTRSIPARSARVKGVRTDSALAARPRLGTRPQTAVVVAVCGSRELIDRGLPALQAACGRAGVHVVLARRDDTVGIASLRGVYPDVRVVAAPANASEAELRSIGLKEARADVVHFIDEATLGDSGAIAERLMRMSDEFRGSLAAIDLRTPLDSRTAVASGGPVGSAARPSVARKA